MQWGRLLQCGRRLWGRRVESRELAMQLEVHGGMRGGTESGLNFVAAVAKAALEELHAEDAKDDHDEAAEHRHVEEPREREHDCVHLAPYAWQARGRAQPAHEGAREWQNDSPGGPRPLLTVRVYGRNAPPSM